MAGFNKKETLIRTICFMSFFVAINVICSFLTTVLPLLSIALIIFLPLTSAVVEVLCKDRWFLIYAFATIGLSIVVSLQSIDFTLFYIVPSIFTGYIFGLCAKRHIPSMFAIFIASLIQTGLSFAFIPLIKLITDQNILDVFVKIFGISDRFWFENLILLIFFIVALMQVTLSYIVVNNELKKFIEPEEFKVNQKLIASYSSLTAVLVSVILVFFSIPVCFLYIAFAFYFLVFIIIEHFKEKSKLQLIFDGISLFITILLYAALNKFFSSGKDFILLLITPGLISISSILHSFLKKSK